MTVLATLGASSRSNHNRFENKLAEAHQWKREFGTALKELHEAKKLQKCYVVYLGTIRLKDGPIEVLPLKDMMRALVNSDVLP